MRNYCFRCFRASALECELAWVSAFCKMLTEANVEAHSFRLEFARELIQSMAKRKAARADLVDSAAAPADPEPTRPDADQRPGSGQTPPRQTGEKNRRV
jgi:hypothetical protein